MRSENEAMDQALKPNIIRIENDIKHFFIETPELTDSDHEGTVDAIHFTDLDSKGMLTF